MKCIKCNSEEKVKNGFVKGVQRYKCKECGYNYTVEKRSGEHSKETKRNALHLYLEGLGFRSIGRLLGVSNVSILNWVRDFGEKAKELQVDDSTIEFAELDEMHSFIGNKKTIAGFGLLLIDLGENSSTSMLATEIKLKIMKQLKHIFFIAIFTMFLFSGAFSQTQPVITITNSPQGTVEQYDMIEISFDIGFYGNPPELNFYDPEEVDVYCIFTIDQNGTTTNEKINAFYYEGYNRTSTPGPGPLTEETLVADQNIKEWRIRFTPELTGQWEYEITANNLVNNTSTSVQGSSIDCQDSDRKGFIVPSQTNSRYLEYSNGGTYMPIGQNYGWYTWVDWNQMDESMGDATRVYGTHEYDYFMDRFEENQGNYFRIWIGHYRSLCLTPDYDFEQGEFFYNRINQKDAWRLDHIIDKAASSNPRINIMPCFFTHQNFKEENNNPIWEIDKNPYKETTGYGDCYEPKDFFTADGARQVTKNHIRYIVARWGYATNVLAWELFNEVTKLLEDNPSNLDDIVAWHTEMYNYIKGLDSKHMISTSFPNVATQDPCPDIANEMDYPMGHWGIYFNISWNSERKYSAECFEIANDHIDQFPNDVYMLGETDYLDPNQLYDAYDQFGYGLHSMNFAQAISGAVGATGRWSWRRGRDFDNDDVTGPDNIFYTHFKPIAQFVTNLELDHEIYDYVFEEPTVGDHIINFGYMRSGDKDFVAGWGQDDAFKFNTFYYSNNEQYLNDFPNDFLNAPPPYPAFGNDRDITISGLKHGMYKLRWFDTSDGTEIEEVTSMVFVEEGATETNISIPAGHDTPYGDFAFVMNYDESSFLRKRPYVFYTNKEGGNNGNFLPEIGKVIVQWQTIDPQLCGLEYGYDETYGTQVIAAQADDNIYYVGFNIDLFPASTMIYYKVDVSNGNEIEIVEASFKTPPASDASNVSFYAYGDTRGASEGTPPVHHNDVCAQIVNLANNDVAIQTMVLHTGDWNFKDSELSWQGEYFNPYDEDAVEMKSKIAVMGAYGNHEIPELEAPSIYNKYYPYSYAEEGRFYYSYNYGPVHIIHVELPSPDSGFEDEDPQLIWIQEDLDNTDKKWKVMVFHAPAYSNSTNEWSWNNVDGQDKLQPLCEEYGVQLVITGHNHYYSHWLVNGVHHLTLGGGGTLNGSWPLNSENLNLGELKAYGFNHFAKININDKVMDIVINSYEKDINSGEWYWKDDFDPFTLPISLKICGGEDETWDEDITYADVIRVCSGNTLTITGDVGFVENGKLIVEPGGKLILDGCTLTNALDNKSWAGIEVWGDPDLSQYEYDGVCHQGIIELKNGATIENAITGVALGAFDENGDPDYSKGGGIIKADFDNAQNGGPTAIFLNNKWGVRFMKYHNYKIGYPPEYEVPNLGFIENCTFGVNQDYLMGSWWYSHIHLFDVDGIKIWANTFTHTKIDNPMGHGINGWKAGFRVSSICDSPLSPCPEGSLVNNTFTNFTKAVNLVMPYYGTYTATVKNAGFYNNSNGVVLAGVNNASLLFNTFELGKADEKDMLLCDSKSAAYGIDLTSCIGFAVEENNFSKATGAPLGNYIGIRITDCKSESDVIYNNSFDGVSVGNQAEGVNKPDVNPGYEKGVTYFCNKNIGNSYDFYVADNSKIANYQGWYSDATGNTLSAGAVVQFQNDYPEEPIIYFFNQMPGAEDEVLLDENASDGVYPTGIDVENTCPSHYGGINPKDVVLSPEQKLEAEQDYAANLTDYNNVKTLFDNLKDGGNTEATLTDVTTAWPNDMWELRAKLLGESPHLSMEVLKAAADKTDVLPESVLFEILSANPDELKKEELIKYLEDKQNPLPSYMVDILRQLANGTTYKTVLLSEMAAYNAKKVGAAQDIVRSILNSDSPDMAELRNWLDNIGGMEADKQIIGTYITEGNYTSAQSLIDMLPGLYELEGDALLAYDDYKTFTGMMVDIEQEGRTIFGLNETELATIVDLAENGHGSAKTSAQGLLEFAYGHDYCNCPDLPEGIGLKSSGATIDMEKLARAKGLEINVGPNPTSTWAAFDYTLPLTATEAVIQITDNSGKIIQQVNIAQQQGQYVLDTRSYKTGIYYFTIICGDLQRTGKLIVK